MSEQQEMYQEEQQTTGTDVKTEEMMKFVYEICQQLGHGKGLADLLCTAKKYRAMYLDKKTRRNCAKAAFWTHSYFVVQHSPASATAEVPPALEADESSVPPSGQVSLKKRKHPDGYRPTMLDELMKSSSDETSSEEMESEEHAPTKIKKRAAKEDLNNNSEVVRSPLAASSGVCEDSRETTNTLLMDKKSTKDIPSYRSPLQECEFVRQPRPSYSSSTRKSVSSERRSGYRRSPNRDHHHPPHRSMSRESRDRYGSRAVERRLPASRECSRYEGPYPAKRSPVRGRPVDSSYRRQHTQQQSERPRSRPVATDRQQDQMSQVLAAVVRSNESHEKTNARLAVLIDKLARPTPERR